MPVVSQEASHAGQAVVEPVRLTGTDGSLAVGPPNFAAQPRVTIHQLGAARSLLAVPTQPRADIPVPIEIPIPLRQRCRWSQQCQRESNPRSNSSYPHVY